MSVCDKSRKIKFQYTSPQIFMCIYNFDWQVMLFCYLIVSIRLFHANFLSDSRKTRQFTWSFALLVKFLNFV